VWCVRPFELVRASPEAKDLLDNGYEFARELKANASTEFEAIVGEILTPIAKARRNLKLSATQIAKISIASLSGFKQSADDAAQLRELIAGLVTITCDSR